MLDKRIMLALNGADDVYLEETAAMLGYITNENERIVAMNYYRRIISIVVAAALVLSLGIVAYATDIFGIRAMQIKENAPKPVRGPDSGYLSITQPQDVPEEMSSEIKDKIENSTKAWAEWDSWRKENGIKRPEVFAPPEGCSTAEVTENADGTYTIIFYKSVFTFGDDGRPVNVEHEEIERRTATAEEYEQDLIYGEAVGKGFNGYDFNYHVYSQQMADKLEEIAAKYGLKLRHKLTQLYQNFGEQTGFLSCEELTAEVDQICAGGKSFFRTAPTGYDKFYFFDEGTFAVSFYTTDDLSNQGTSCYLYNSPYGTLSSGFEIISAVKDLGAMETYVHTTPDGTELTVLHNGADMFAYVYLENSFVSMTFHQANGLSSDEINAIIDMVDFSVIG